MHGARFESERLTAGLGTELLHRSDRSIGGLARSRRKPCAMKRLRQSHLGAQKAGIQAHGTVELFDRVTVPELAKRLLGLLIEKLGFLGGRSAGRAVPARRAVVLPAGEQPLAKLPARKLRDGGGRPRGGAKRHGGVGLARPVGADRRVVRVVFLVERPRDDPADVGRLPDGRQGRRARGLRVDAQEDVAHAVARERPHERRFRQIGGQKIGE